MTATQHIRQPRPQHPTAHGANAPPHEVHAKCCFNRGRTVRHSRHAFAALLLALRPMTCTAHQPQCHRRLSGASMHLCVSQYSTLHLMSCKIQHLARRCLEAYKAKYLECSGARPRTLRREKAGGGPGGGPPISAAAVVRPAAGSAGSSAPSDGLALFLLGPSSAWLCSLSACVVKSCFGG